MTRLLDEGQRWRFDHSNCLPWLAGLPADCADLVVCSPPYTGARLYLEAGENLGIARGVEEWVAWMREVVCQCLRVCTGLIAVVCDDQQVDFSYGGAPFLLLADLIRAGVACRKPCIYKRHGAPGGSDDWLRNLWEPVLCFTRGGRLPWSKPTACGRPPKFGPGGAMSNRRADGSRVGTQTCGVTRRPKGVKERADEPQGRKRRPLPAIANPGNVIDCLEETAPDVIDCGAVGGGNMGDNLATENEAPFPEKLADFLVRTFAPPGGLVLDPFSGSGTTVAVAVKCGRRGMGCDLRPSQVALATRRLLEVTPPLPGLEP